MPTQRPSIISRLLFLWVTPFIKRNTRQMLDQDSLLELPTDINAEQETVQFIDNMAKYKGRFSLHRAVLYQNRGKLVQVFLVSLVLLVASLTNPILLRLLIQSLQGHPHNWGRTFQEFITFLGLSSEIGSSLLIVVLIFGVMMVSIVSIHNMFFVELLISVRLRLALSGAIYRKTLVLSRRERKENSNGFIINLVAVDAQKVDWFFAFIHSIWFHPIQIICAVYILYQIVGVPALYGSLVLVFILVMCALTTRIQARIRRALMAISDQRVGLMNEVLTHIKTVKFYAWEDELTRRITRLRNLQVAKARQLAILGALTTFAGASSPALAMVVTFTLVVFRGGSLDPAIIFPSLALLMTLRFAVSVLPEIISNLVDAHVALTRLKRFFSLSEWTEPPSSNHIEIGVAINEARFDWQPGEKALELGSFCVRSGELVAVVGSVGSGKSALLLGILGELSTTAGSVQTKGTIAYVAQQPWIVSDTIRNNILCAQAYDPKRYQRSLEASGLGPDIALFPNKDLTEIGERGVNLSGGQRQRLALARALYAQADIYLLDDPLSALDAAVANSVFEELILKDLAATARILVTHRLEYALRADRVIVVENGQVTDSGPPEILMQGTNRFRELFDFHEQSHGHELLTQKQDNSPTLSDYSLNSALVEQGPNVGERIIIDEDRQTGAVNRSVIWSYIGRFVPGWGILILLAIFSIRQLASVGTDLWLARYSSVPNISVNVFIGGYFGFVLVLCLFNFLRSLHVLLRGLSAGTESHSGLLSGVLHAPLRFFESNPVGRIVNRFSRDLETIDTGLPRSILEALSCLFEVLTVLIMIVVIQPLALIVITPILWIYYRLQLMFRPTSREGQRIDSITRSPIFAQFSESLNGIETIRAFGLIDSLYAQFDRSLNINGRAFFSVIGANRWLGIRLESLGALITLCAGISGAFLVKSPYGAALSGFMVTYAIGITGSMNWLVRMFSQTESNLTSFERIETYANTPSERFYGDYPRPGWPEQGQISFTDLTLKYRPELSAAISQLTCTVKSQEKIGIVGRTGSGKSTLVLGLLRLIEPSAGSVSVDGLNLSSLDLRTVRQAITVIPQEPVLFSGTIRDNIDPFGQYSQNEIVESLARVELSKFVGALPLGLDAPIQESGANLSSGQRQLFCLARALLKKSKIIVMDEATAQIDVETDVAVQRTIRREFSYATVLVVAHRLGTVMDSDRILVLDGGKLAEFAPPEELLSRPNSLFRALVRELRTGDGQTITTPETLADQ